MPRHLPHSAILVLLLSLFSASAEPPATRPATVELDLGHGVIMKFAGIPSGTFQMAHRPTKSAATPTKRRTRWPSAAPSAWGSPK